MQFCARKRHLRLTILSPACSVGGARIQSDDHHVQANLPAAKTTTHTMRNRNIETAKLACCLNSLRPSLIRVVRRKKIERTKRKIGIAAARKAMTLKITLSVLLRRLAAQLVPPEIRILVQRPRQTPTAGFSRTTGQETNSRAT